MKTRFYLIVLSGLVLSSVLTTVVHAYFFQKERYHLIDDQLERDVSLLMSSPMTRDDLKDLQDANEMFSDIFGDDGDLSHFFLIYDHKGRLLYQTDNSFQLPDSVLNAVEERGTYQFDHHIVRTLYKELPRRGLQVRVGVFLDLEATQWSYSLGRAFFASFVILIFLLFLGFFLNERLFGPLGRISEFLAYWVRNFESREMPKVDVIKSRLITRYRSRLFKKDEFSALLESVYELIRTVSVSWQKQKKFNAIFAHELKTPLTVLSNTLQSVDLGLPVKKDKAGQKSLDPLEDAKLQVFRLAEFVDNFLGLIRLNTDPSKKILAVQAIDLVSLFEALITELARVYDRQVTIITSGDRWVAAGEPALARQLFENILTNAMKYSPQDKEILVHLKPGLIEVQDFGQGIPDEVMARIGEPFNRDRSVQNANQVEGHGLGLCWVTSIVDLLGWKYEIKTGPTGTTWILKPL